MRALMILAAAIAALLGIGFLVDCTKELILNGALMLEPRAQAEQVAPEATALFLFIAVWLTVTGAYHLYKALKNVG